MARRQKAQQCDALPANTDGSAYRQKAIAAAAMDKNARVAEDAEAQVTLMEPSEPTGTQAPAVAVRSLALVPVQAASE